MKEHDSDQWDARGTVICLGIILYGGLTSKKGKQMTTEEKISKVKESIKAMKEIEKLEKEVTRLKKNIETKKAKIEELAKAL